MAEKSNGKRRIEVPGRAAKVYSFNRFDGQLGFYGRAGDLFQLGIWNDIDSGIITHPHGQVMAAEGQHHAYLWGGEPAPGALGQLDFELPPGTHRMHAHQVSEEMLMTAPMICRETQAEDIQERVIMLYDFGLGRTRYARCLGRYGGK